MELHLNNVMGIHSCFYYCGAAHLLVNMFAYIAAGIKNNEKIYISMEEYLFVRLTDCFKKKDVNEFLNFKSVKELINNHKSSGLTGLKEELHYHVTKSTKEGFNGIRWIGQSIFAIQETSKQDFLNCEKHLTEAVKGTKSSLVCNYDFFDYVNTKEYIDDEVFEGSKNTHSHKLYNFKLINEWK